MQSRILQRQRAEGIIAKRSSETKGHWRRDRRKGGILVSAQRDFGGLALVNTEASRAGRRACLQVRQLESDVPPWQRGEAD